MKLKPELNDQLKHYASQLNKTIDEIDKEIEEWGKDYPDITDKVLRAHIWGTQKNMALPLRTVIPAAAEKYYLIQNLIDLAKKGIKNVNIRGYVLAQMASQKGSPQVILADESGIARITIQDKEKWQNLNVKDFDPIYFENMGIWKPNPQEEKYIYTASQYSAFSKVPAGSIELKMPAPADIKSTRISDLKEKETTFINGYITGVKENRYLGCSKCRKKTTVAEGEFFTCPKCGEPTVMSKKIQIKQIAIGEPSSGDDILCTLPTSMESTNIDLLKGISVGLIGYAEKRKDTDELVFRVNILLKKQEQKSMEQQYKNASDTAIKYFQIQPNFTVKKEEFISWLRDRFSSLSPDELTKYMVKNSLIAENGTFLTKK